MWWQLIVGAANGLLQGSAGRATAKANNRISKVNKETTDKLRTASNATQAAQNSLARYVQSVNNQRTLDAGGRALEAGTVNYLRQKDAAAVGGISRQVAQAEQAGAQAAAAGYAGLIGGAVDMVNTSTGLRDAIVERTLADRENSADWDQARRQGRIAAGTIDSLDNSMILDSFDWSQSFAQETPVFSHWMNAIQGMGQSFGATGQGEDIMRRNPGTGSADFSRYSSTGSVLRGTDRYQLVDSETSSGAKFGFKESADSNPFSLASSGETQRLGDTKSEFRFGAPKEDTGASSFSYGGWFSNLWSK